MTVPFDHHVHSSRSDGAPSLEGRAQTARDRPHGVSDHFPWPGGMRDDDDVLRYVDDARRLGLRVGIEYDLGVAPRLRPSTREALDYLIGAIHQVFRGGERIGFDEAGAFLKGERTTFAERERFADADLARFVLEETLRLVREGIVEHGIDIVGHPLFTPLLVVADPESAYPAEWQERFIALCAESDVAIEVNETYGVPHREFLVRARAAGARFSVGSDTHRELRPLGRTRAMLEAAALPVDRFLGGRRIRTWAAPQASSDSSS